MSLLKSKFFRLPQHRHFHYVPRYYDEEEEERRELFDQKLTLERGGFFNSKNKSRLVGAFSEKEIVFRRRPSSSGQMGRVSLLTVMLTLPVLYLMDKINGVSAFIAFIILLILMVLFIMRANRF